MGIPDGDTGGVPNQPTFPVVGLGASAGGLVALKRLLEHTRSNCGMAAAWLPRLMPRRAPIGIEPTHERDAPWASLRLLIVDDTREAVDSLARLLEFEEATVLRTYGHEQALELLATHEVDAVLSDLGMPDMDGYQFAERVQADVRLRHGPLIAVTGFARSDDIKRATAAGFAAHIGKPIQLETLAEVIGQVRERAAAKATPEPQAGTETAEATNCATRAR